MENISIITILNYLFITYASLLFLSYVLAAILSVLKLRSYIVKNRHFDYQSMLSYDKLPSVSVIAPAYNEERNIIENIKSLMSLKYIDFDVIIINDGSTDSTLEKIVQYFELVKTNTIYHEIIPTSRVNAIYRSTNSAFYNLIVVDKENGGKSDALNTGVNISQKELYMALDVDCILESDAILRMVKPFILEKEDKEVIATGGVIRIANSCDISNGRIMKINYPNSIWAKFQVLEYFRAFALGRMAWSKLNALLIISGAFGMFERKRVLEVGGYDKGTVGEDLELVIRLRRHMHEVEKKDYKVAFIPDPLCWTEVPETFKLLAIQRNRWTRGAIESIFKHFKMFLNPKYKTIGVLSFPYWVFFEWLAPIIQFIGIIYMIILFILGMVNMQIFIIMLLFVFSFAIMYSFFAIYFEAYTYHKYKDSKYFFRALFLSCLEMFTYQPLNMIFAITGDYDLVKRKKHWGEKDRQGFNKEGKHHYIKKEMDNSDKTEERI